MFHDQFSLVIQTGYQHAINQQNLHQSSHHALLIKARHFENNGASVETTPLFIDGNYINLAIQSSFEQLADQGLRENDQIFKERIQDLIEGLHQYFKPSIQNHDSSDLSEETQKNEEQTDTALVSALDEINISTEDLERYQLKTGDILVTARAQRLGVYRFIHPKDCLKKYDTELQCQWHYIANHSFFVIKAFGDTEKERLSNSSALLAWLHSSEAYQWFIQGNQMNAQGWRFTKKYLKKMNPPVELFDQGSQILKLIHQNQDQRMIDKLKHRVIAEHERLVMLENVSRILKGQPHVPPLISDTKVCREAVLALCRKTAINLEKTLPPKTLSMQESDLKHWIFDRQEKEKYKSAYKEFIEKLTGEDKSQRQLMFVPGVTKEKNQEPDKFIFDAMIALMLCRSIEISRGVSSRSDSFIHSITSKIFDLLHKNNGQGLIDEQAEIISDEIIPKPKPKNRKQKWLDLEGQLKEVELAHDKFKKILTEFKESTH